MRFTVGGMCVAAGERGRGMCPLPRFEILGKMSPLEIAFLKKFSEYLPKFLDFPFYEIKRSKSQEKLKFGGRWL